MFIIMQEWCLDKSMYNGRSVPASYWSRQRQASGIDIRIMDVDRLAFTHLVPSTAPQYAAPPGPQRNMRGWGGSVRQGCGRAKVLPCLL